MRSFLIVSCLLLVASASAQKLPNVQLTGLRAPAKVKADGTLSEWGDLQAYNKATQVYYTIANDDNNLYLTIQAKEADIIKKMILGGVSLSINNLGQKSLKNSVTITYPHYDLVNKPFNAIFTERQEITKDLLKNSSKADSLMILLNKQISTRLKMIQIEGVKAIEDSVISIYNQNGIKVVGLFDNELNYTCELVVPLKYLSLKKLAKFNYNLKINSTVPKNATITLSGSGNFLSVTVDGSIGSAMAATQQNRTLFYSTDFWGEYELVK